MYELMLSRVEVNTNCQVENPTEADFQETEYWLFAGWRNANTICGECCGVDDSHYLSCSVWGFLDGQLA